MGQYGWVVSLRQKQNLRLWMALQAGRESGLVTLSCGTGLGESWRADHMMFSDDAYLLM